MDSEREGAMKATDWLCDFLIAIGFQGDGDLAKPSPDPFGDAVRAAQARETADPAVIPHPVTRPATEAEREALWRSIEDYGRGG